MIQITPIHEGPYVYCKKLHEKYIFILTQEFPLVVWDVIATMPLYKMTFKRLNLLTVLEKKTLFTHSNLKISNKFGKIREGVNIPLRINILLCGNPFYKWMKLLFILI